MKKHVCKYMSSTQNEIKKGQQLQDPLSLEILQSQQYLNIRNKISTSLHHVCPNSQHMSSWYNRLIKRRNASFSYTPNNYQHAETTRHECGITFPRNLDVVLDETKNT